MPAHSSGSLNPGGAPAPPSSAGLTRPPGPPMGPSSIASALGGTVSAPSSQHQLYDPSLVSRQMYQPHQQHLIQQQHHHHHHLTPYPSHLAAAANSLLPGALHAPHHPGLPFKQEMKSDEELKKEALEANAKPEAPPCNCFANDKGEKLDTCITIFLLFCTTQHIHTQSHTHHNKTYSYFISLPF